MTENQPTEASQPTCGHGARHVFEIPWRGWRAILQRGRRSIGDDNIAIIAAGVAFYMLLAIFPALTALVSMYGLISNPAEVQNQLQTLRNLMPEEAYQVINQQLSAIVQGSGGALGLSFVISLLFTFWSASRGIKALIHAFNIAYNEREQRGIIAFSMTALLLTIGLVLFLVVALLLVVALPAMVEALGLSMNLVPWVMLLRWPILLLTVITALAILYRYAPCRARIQLKWVLPGAIIMTALWLLASYLFSFYVQNFGKYNQVYGSLSAVIILLLYFYLTAYFVLLGAELNSEIESQVCTEPSADAEPAKPNNGDAVSGDNQSTPAAEADQPAEPPADSPAKETNEEPKRSPSEPEKPDSD